MIYLALGLSWTVQWFSAQYPVLFTMNLLSRIILRFDYSRRTELNWPEQADPVTHTRTHLTALCPGLPGWAGTRKVKPIWILLKQQTVSGSGISWAICKSAPCSRQTTTPAPHHSVFYRPDALPAARNIQQRQSTEVDPVTWHVIGHPHQHHKVDWTYLVWTYLVCERELSSVRLLWTLRLKYMCSELEFSLF